MLKNCSKFTSECSRLLATSNLSNFSSKLLDLKAVRTYNIRSSEHIAKIGDQLLCKEDQLVLLNLPNEQDYLLPSYLLERGQRCLFLALGKEFGPYDAVVKAAEQSHKTLKVLETINFLNLKMYHKATTESKQTIYKDIIQNFQVRQWSEKPIAKLFMIIPDGKTSIIRSFIGQISHFSGLFANGRVELYFLLTELEYKRLKLKSFSPVFFYNSYNFLFDYETLDKFKWSDLKISGKNKKGLKNEEYCYFVKLIPKSSLADLPAENLRMFIQFLAKMSMKKKQLIIALLESWFPGIGLKMIDLGYSVFTDLGSLETEDYFKIFNFLMEEERDAFTEIISQ